MKNFSAKIALACLVAGSYLFSACNSIKGVGPLVITSRQVNEIKSIDLEMHANVYLIKGDTQSVVISAQQNILDVLKTEVKGDKLIINSSESISVTQPVELWITVKNIEDIELSGSGNIASTTEFTSDKITVDLSGSGKISLVIAAEKFSGDISGSGDIYLKGKVSKADLDISGSGNIFANDCAVDKCKIDLNGSGDAKINVLSELNASIDGSGSILYSGNPQKVKSDVNGSGHISRSE